MTTSLKPHRIGSLSPEMALLLCFFAFVLLLSGCGTPANEATEPKALSVFAAASLRNAFSEIGKAFEADNPGVTVKFNFGGSQTLRTQIE